MVYALAETGSYTTSIPTGTDAGSYTVWYKVERTENYSGSAVPVGAIQGTATADGKNIPGTWSFADGQSLTNVADSGTRTVILTPINEADYLLFLLLFPTLCGLPGDYPGRPFFDRPERRVFLPLLPCPVNRHSLEVGLEPGKDLPQPGDSIVRPPAPG